MVLPFSFYSHQFLALIFLSVAVILYILNHLIFFKLCIVVGSRLKSGNACYHSVRNIWSSSLLTRALKINTYRTIIFLISHFRRVLNVVCFLLSNSLASEFYMPTFRKEMVFAVSFVGKLKSKKWFLLYHSSANSKVRNGFCCITRRQIQK
jgi:hypothetical protein